MFASCGSFAIRLRSQLGFVALGSCLLLASCSPAETGLTRLNVTRSVVLPAVARLGVNLGEQTFYDSGIMLRNLLSRNPGFEGGSYRTIFHCTQAAGRRCVDVRGGLHFDEGFWAGAQFEVLDGAAIGQRGAVLGSTAAGSGLALTLNAAAPVSAGDWIAVEKAEPGSPTEGWWPQTGGSGRLLAETRDLSPNTEGHQALRMESAGAASFAQVNSYLDSTEGRSFLHLNGRYRLSMKAKALAAGCKLHLHVARLAPGVGRYLNTDLPLGQSWTEIHQEFTAHEAGLPAAALEVSLRISSGAVLLDDVSLERIDGNPANQTAFRDEVLETLQELHPGVLRMMGSAEELGSTVDNLLLPQAARQRPGYRSWYTPGQDVPYGLNDFLGLCQAVAAEPWITLPAATSREEMRLLADYLAGAAGSPGGRLRAREGHAEPWTKTFPTIHLELGNETWNSIYQGETMEDAAAYGRRAGFLFAAFRTQAAANAAHFDLAVNTNAYDPARNQALLAPAGQTNTLALAPYLMFSVTEWANDRQLYGPLLAEPEMLLGPTGALRKAAESAHGRQLAVYEVNLHTTRGSAPAAVLDRLTPSAAAGVAVSGFMLRMMRELGVRSQMLFALPQFAFRRDDGTNVRLWGSVVEMGSAGRKRPQFLAEALVNKAIRGDMVQVDLSGDLPAHDQPLGNNGVKLAHVHELDAYAFQQGKNHSLVVFNYGLEQSRRLQLAGPGLGANANVGQAAHLATVWRLLSPGPGATNENREEVTIHQEALAGNELTLAPCSMAVVEWEE